MMTAGQSALLRGARIRAVEYIVGSIFHLEAESGDGRRCLVVVNGCRWAIVDGGSTLVLHDEAALSQLVLEELLGGARVVVAETALDRLTLRFERASLHAFSTRRHHEVRHDGIRLGSVEWNGLPAAAREAVMFFGPARGEEGGIEFRTHLDPVNLDWGRSYLSAQPG